MISYTLLKYRIWFCWFASQNIAWPFIPFNSAKNSWLSHESQPFGPFIQKVVRCI